MSAVYVVSRLPNIQPYPAAGLRLSPRIFVCYSVAELFVAPKYSQPVYLLLGDFTHKYN